MASDNSRHGDLPAAWVAAVIAAYLSSPPSRDMTGTRVVLQRLFGES
jgi:hypothetical protein